MGTSLSTKTGIARRVGWNPLQGHAGLGPAMTAWRQGCPQPTRLAVLVQGGVASAGGASVLVRLPHAHPGRDLVSHARHAARQRRRRRHLAGAAGRRGADAALAVGGRAPAPRPPRMPASAALLSGTGHRHGAGCRDSRLSAACGVRQHLPRLDSQSDCSVASADSAAHASFLFREQPPQTPTNTRPAASSPAGTQQRRPHRARPAGARSKLGHPWARPASGHLGIRCPALGRDPDRGGR